MYVRMLFHIGTLVITIIGQLYGGGQKKSLGETQI